MNRDRKIFHSEMPKRDWPDVRASHAAYCRWLGFPKLPSPRLKKLPPTEEDLRDRRATYRANNGPQKIALTPEELIDKRRNRHNKFVLHSEMPKRDWPNMRRTFSKFCGALGLPLPVSKSKQYPDFQKSYRKEHREHLNNRAAERKRIRRKLYPEEMRAKQRKENKLRRLKTDFRTVDNLRRRVHKSLKEVCKSAKTKELLGCPGVWLQVHLESLFKPGMNMGNYGSIWHIDHVKPCAAFDLAAPEQQRICFHWTNLQPLFALENIKKGDKYVGPN